MLWVFFGDLIINIFVGKFVFHVIFNFESLNCMKINYLAEKKTMSFIKSSKKHPQNLYIFL